ncbi:hypothetical protein TNCV_572691 [Trichonephila clavipes]|nr:hypothetical protein TNCV_572691 [Trichonephila clavipes]
MPRRRIRAHYEQLLEFERGCIIGLKEGGYNHDDWGRIGRIRFQLCPDDHRKRVWRRQLVDPVFTIARHTGPIPEVMVWGAIFLQPESFGRH